jgi:RecA-family ATPase
VLPNNGAAEQGVLGAILRDNRIFFRVAGLVSAEHFYWAVHRRIFAAAASRISAGSLADPITLKKEFDHDEALQTQGGAKYLMQLATDVPTLTNAEDYARIVVEFAKARDIITAGEQLIADAYSIDFSRGIGDMTARMQGQLDEISRNAPDRLDLINPVSLIGEPVPQRGFIVPRWIPLGRVTGLYGEPGAGKSLLMQMLCTAPALGLPWLGLPIRRWKSVLFYCEDDKDEMHARQDAINRFYGCTYDDLGDMRWLARLGYDNMLMTFDHGRGTLTPLFHQILGEVRRFRAQLVVVDTLSDVFAGSEIDRGQARQFVQGALGYMGRETRGAIVACAHPSLTGINTGTGTSGSTGWSGAFRSHLYLEKQKRDDERGSEPVDANRVLSRRKSNWAPPGEPIELCFQDGVFVVVPSPEGVLGAISKRAVEEDFLKLLDKFTKQNRPVSDTPTAGNYAPKLFARHTAEHERRYKFKDYVAAMDSLFAADRIRNEVYGSKAEPHRRIVRTPSPIK